MSFCPASPRPRQKVRPNTIAFSLQKCGASVLRNGEQPDKVRINHPLRGATFESFVVGELTKAFTHLGREAPFFFWRDAGGHETDVLLDLGDRLLRVEVKSGMTVSPDMVDGLCCRTSLPGNQHKRGVLVHGGERGYSLHGFAVRPWYLGYDPASVDRLRPELRLTGRRCPFQHDAEDWDTIHAESIFSMTWLGRHKGILFVAPALASCTVLPLPRRSDGAGEELPSTDAGLADPGGSDGGLGASFATDIFPLLKRSCSCHVDGTTGPALDSYANVLFAADISNTVIQEGSMPPSRPLSAADKTLFQSWIDAGKPNN